MRALLDLQITRDLARECGLSEADHTVLVVLSEASGHRMRMMELAERVLWSRSRLSHHLQRMQDRGLVRRERREDGSRAVEAVLTTRGLRTIEAAEPKHVDSIRRNLFDHLTAEELCVLGDISEKVVAHLRRVVGSPL
jgi:DNA-binding MarR family transcriptional regulator